MNLRTRSILSLLPFNAAAAFSFQLPYTYNNRIRLASSIEINLVKTATRTMEGRRTSTACECSSNVNVNANAPLKQQKKVVFNILCLHGKGSSGEQFQKTLKPFEEALFENSNSVDGDGHGGYGYTFNFKYLDAPFPMESDDGDGDNKNAATNTNKTYQWWTLPPGVRSFNAVEYTGYEDSAEKVYNELLLGGTGAGAGTGAVKGYDFIFGHSQGAILLSSMITSRTWREKVIANTNTLRMNDGDDGDNDDNDNDSDSDSNVHVLHHTTKPLGYIFNGCAWPNPFSAAMMDYRYEHEHEHDDDDDNNDSNNGSNRQPQMLFIIGEKDRINPPEGATRVRDALSKGLGSIIGGTDTDDNDNSAIETCYHPAGHAVPVSNKDALNRMVKWVLRVAAAANQE